ncbi:hypothetical protein [Catenovulum agarivorans]|uniref:hypothetical protein n=1 Tax=Catenovulum agarivorans TaxID=1172192 RepID=UPI0012F90057|nr:hypothetical protein [Catenovulum agarivorans]
MSCLPQSFIANATELTAGFYFPPYQFSKAQFQYTQTLLAPEIELVPFYAAPSEQDSVLVAGYDNAYHLATHVKNAHELFAVVLGVNEQEGKKLEQLRCQAQKHCSSWVYINENASVERLRYLTDKIFADHNLVSVSKNLGLISRLSKEWPELQILSTNQAVEKEFELIKKASILGDVFVLLPDDELYDDATGRTVLQYLFQQKVISIGFSSGSYNAGAMLASYADYPNMLLTAKLKLLNHPAPEQTLFLNACYQDYYINEPLLSRIFGEQLANVVDFDSLYILADELNFNCNKKLQ